MISNFLKKIKDFLREVIVEMKKTTWLSRKEILHYTIIVLAASLFVAMVLGLFDFGFFNFLNRVIIK